MLKESYKIENPVTRLRSIWVAFHAFLDIFLARPTGAKIFYHR